LFVDIPELAIKASITEPLYMPTSAPSPPVPAIMLLDGGVGNIGENKAKFALRVSFTTFDP
jgi:hypothetical protein